MGGGGCGGGGFFFLSFGGVPRRKSALIPADTTPCLHERNCGPSRPPAGNVEQEERDARARSQRLDCAEFVGSADAPPPARRRRTWRLSWHRPRDDRRRRPRPGRR